MLLHEWLQYRDRRIRKLHSQVDEEEKQAEEAEAQEEAEAEGPAEANGKPVEVAPAKPRDLLEPTQEEHEPPPAVAVEEGEVEPVLPEPVPAAPREPVERKLSVPRPPTRSSGKTARDVLETLQPTQDVRSRLEKVLARQRRLPLEEIEEQEARPREGRAAAETREQLVGRLLDPTLTLQETALLLGVCPTTVRRYTNRGILRCFRTPGNQRRFKLSEVLEFMERREGGEA